MNRYLKPFCSSFLLVCVLTFSSCTEQEPVEPEVQTGLLGTWRNESLSIIKCQEGHDANPANQWGCNDETCIKFRFGENGAFSVIARTDSEEETMNGVFHIYREHVTMNIDGDAIEADYEINNSTLTLTVSSEDVGCDIEIVFVRD